MQNQKSNRYTLVVAILFLYLFPLCLLTGYSAGLLSPDPSWSALSTGLLLTSFGALVFFLLMSKWEESLQSWQRQLLLAKNTSPKYVEDFSLPLPPPQKVESIPTDVDQLKKEIEEYQSKQKELLGDIQKLQSERERYQRQAELLLQEYAQYKGGSQEELEQKGSLLAEYQQTVSEQRSVIEKNVQQIGSLESKVKDLSYEIKTLLHLGEMSISSTSKTQPFSLKEESVSYDIEPDFVEEATTPSDKMIHTPEQAAIQLRRCIDIAQKITGAHHFNNPTLRFREYSMDNYTLDLRRLFDSLRSENSCGVVFYSQKENKLLFANNVMRNLLGWSPDKFVQGFPEIVQGGMADWRAAVVQLPSTNEAKIRLLLRTKTGQDVPFHCHLGIIPTGLFRSHILAVMYPV